MFERKKQGGKIYLLPIDQIQPSPFQARKVFDEQELAALAQSIRENGLLQPVSVRRTPEGYQLVAGSVPAKWQGCSRSPPSSGTAGRSAPPHWGFWRTSSGWT